MKKKPLKMNEKIHRDLRNALEHVHKLMSKDGRARHGILLDERYTAAFTEEEKTRIGGYLESWILGPLANAISSIEAARYVTITVTTNKADCSCGTFHSDATHETSITIEDDGRGFDGNEFITESDSETMDEDAKELVKERSEHYRKLGHEVRIRRVTR